jgi:hypothetical protein
MPIKSLKPSPTEKKSSYLNRKAQVVIILAGLFVLILLINLIMGAMNEKTSNPSVISLNSSKTTNVSMNTSSNQVNLYISSWLNWSNHWYAIDHNIEEVAQQVVNKDIDRIKAVNELNVDKKIVQETMTIINNTKVPSGLENVQNLTLLAYNDTYNSLNEFGYGIYNGNPNLLNEAILYLDSAETKIKKAEQEVNILLAKYSEKSKIS